MPITNLSFPWDDCAPRPTSDREALDLIFRSCRGMCFPQLGRRVRTCPVTQNQARYFIEQFHRHRPTLTGWKFGFALRDDQGLLGVVCVGRPVSRHLDDGHTLEVNRLCVMTNLSNGASILLGAAARCASIMGYARLVTYTLENESGASLRATGWTPVATFPTRTWDTPSRRREEPEDEPITLDKTRWVLSLNGKEKTSASEDDARTASPQTQGSRLRSG